MIAADMRGLGLRASQYSGCEIFSGTRRNAHGNFRVDKVNTVVNISVCETDK